MGARLAFAVRPSRKLLAFSTLEEGWVLDLQSSAAPILAGVLRAQMLDREGAVLIARDLVADLQDFCRLISPLTGLTTAELYRRVAPVCRGDLLQAGLVSGQPVLSRKAFKSIEDDAYEVALLLPQYEHAIGPYYEKAGVPFAKLQAESLLLKANEKPLHWWVSYPEVWLRVLAHWSGDPTMKRAFLDRRDLLGTMAGLIETTPDKAEALLLWQCCGREMAVLEQRMPEIISALPNDLDAWGNKLDRAFPVLVGTCQQMIQAYWESRSAHTLYGRKLSPGRNLGEAVAWRIFGTVEDIVVVAAVTLWQNRPSSDVVIGKIEGGPAASLIRIGGSGGPSYSWLALLNQLAPLANPLSIPLDPSVIEA